MFDNARISAIARNFTVGSDNSPQFIAGEVADSLCIRVMQHPSVTDSDLNTLWQRAYDVAFATATAVRGA